MASEQPAADEWQQIKQCLSALYHPVYLDCDGYVVRLALERVGEMGLGITVFVDGILRGSWVGVGSTEPAEPGRRFFQARSEYLWSPRHRKKLVKSVGKRRARELGVYERYTYRMPYWRSAESLRRHFVRHNDRIVWITTDEGRRRVEQVRTEA